MMSLSLHHRVGAGVKGMREGESCPISVLNPPSLWENIDMCLISNVKTGVNSGIFSEKKNSLNSKNNYLSS